jgi:hypothetical protein
MSDPTAGNPARLGEIEVLSRAGHVVKRAAWDGRPLRIGRAFDNELVVTDPYVCPHHLELEVAGGRLIARDLGSVNGTYAGRDKKRIDRVELVDGVTLHFGHTQLRFHAADGVMAPTLRDTARHGLFALMDAPWTLAPAAFLSLAALTLNEVMNTADQPGWLTIAGELLYPLIGVLLWAGFWSLLNRVISHRANFHVHLAIGLFGVTGLFLVAQLISIMGFALGWSDAVWWLKLLGRMAVLGGVIYAHLRYALHGRNGRIAGIAALAAVMLFGAPATGDIIERNEFSTLPHLDPLLWPPSFRIIEGESVIEFFDGAQVLRHRADEDARR